MDQQQQYKLKHNLGLVIYESFDRAASKKFKELNFVFPSSEYELKRKRKFLDNKISILNNLDIYSKTFLSIHTRAKIALREIQNNKKENSSLDWAYLELLKMILTLNENIAKKKSVGIREKEKHEWDLMEVGERLYPEYAEVKTINIPVKKVKYLKENVTGEEITKAKDKVKTMINKCSDIQL